jgi:hypothetical protein
MLEKTKVFFLLMVVLFAGCWLFASDKAGEKPPKKLLRVGVFDSRAVAIAFGGLEQFHKELEAKKAELNKAKEQGDANKVKELEKWGNEHQARLHKQGFGTAPVHDLLEYIKDDMPKIAKQAGVDVIVSKWEIAYQEPSVEMVDITDLIVKPFNPGEKQLKWIEQMKDIKPTPEDELDRLEKEGKL